MSNNTSLWPPRSSTSTSTNNLKPRPSVLLAWTLGAAVGGSSSITSASSGSTATTGAAISTVTPSPRRVNPELSQLSIDPIFQISEPHFLDFVEQTCHLLRNLLARDFANG